MGGNRSKASIETRVRTLNLHLELSSDEDEHSATTSSDSGSEVMNNENDESGDDVDGRDESGGSDTEGNTSKNSEIAAHSRERRRPREVQSRRSAASEGTSSTPKEKTKSKKYSTSANQILNPSSSSAPEVDNSGLSWLDIDSDGAMSDNEKWSSSRSFKPSTVSALTGRVAAAPSPEAPRVAEAISSDLPLFPHTQNKEVVTTSAVRRRIQHQHSNNDGGDNHDDDDELDWVLNEGKDISVLKRKNIDLEAVINGENGESLLLSNDSNPFRNSEGEATISASRLSLKKRKILVEDDSD